jgi:hypothetical protein
MTTSPTTTTPSVPTGADVASRIAALRHRVDGDVLVPGDDGYVGASSAWDLAVVHRPAVVVVADNVGDVIATVRFAADLGRGLGVQASGHGVVCPVDGVLLVTNRLREVVVDAEERTAWVAAGSTSAAVLAAAQAHGLAPLVGSSPDVGMVGYTIGGGLGWLARKHGPACDAVRSYEVVTPDGSLVRACRTENPELFRALSGGAGACGVITDMEVALVPVTDVYAGNLYYPAEAAAEVLARWAAWVADAPDELTSAVVLLNEPPVDEVPEERRGRSFTVVRGCWCGPIEQGRALLDEWRAAMPPSIDAWAEMPFAEAATISQDPVQPMPFVGTGGWLVDVGAEVGAVLAAGTFPAGGPPPLVASEIRHLGGAVADADRTHTTMGNRDRRFLLQMTGRPVAPGDAAVIEAHQRAMKAALGASLSERTYLNFLTGDERRSCAPTALDPADRRAIADTCARLDPDDLLRFGIAP